MQNTPPFETKFAGGDQPVALVDDARIQGYASRFGQTDQGGDQVVPGAFKASLGALRAQGRQVKMLWQHDPTQPIGVWDDLREDDIGLYVSGRILTETRQGAEATALVAAGVIDGLSIGYRTKRSNKSRDGQRQLLEVDLWEISLVTFPMLTSARVAAPASKQADADRQALCQITQSLRQATRALQANPKQEIPQ